MTNNRRSDRFKLLYSIDAFMAGLLFILAILLVIVEKPSDLLGILTDIAIDFSLNSRILSFPVAAIMLAISIWRSRKIYRSGTITSLMQLGLGLLACALVFIRIFIFIIDLRKAILGGIMSL